MLSIHDVRSAIKNLGLSGQAVCLHSSLRSFCDLEGGAAAVVDAFLSEDCTILVPTFSDDFNLTPPVDIRPQRNGWTYGSTPDQSEGIGRIYYPTTNEITIEDMGAIPAEVLNRPQRVRGQHPLCSFAAVGSKAEVLIANQTPTDIFAPIQALCQLAGSVVLIGVGLDKMTLLHAAEELAGRKPFIRWANGSDGKPLGAATGGCSNGFEHLAPILSPIIRGFEVGPSSWRIYPANEALQAAASEIRSNSEITQCENPKCERCPDAIQGGPIWNKEG